MKTGRAATMTGLWIRIQPANSPGSATLLISDERIKRLLIDKRGLAVKRSHKIPSTYIYHGQAVHIVDSSFFFKF